MIAKAGYPLVVVLSVLCAHAAQAQDSPAHFGGLDQSPGAVSSMPAPDVPAPAIGANAAPGPQDAGRFMSYITYERPDCCGPVCGGPICYELYTRTGPDLAVGSGFLSGTLDTGWMFEGGGRSLFFNSYQDAAWVVDIGIIYQYNHAGAEKDFTFLGNNVHVSSLQRTSFDLGFGREYYLWRSAKECGSRWRLGWQAGARIGSARLDLNLSVPGGTLERLSDTIGAAYAGLHTDFEWPCCDCATLLFGFRAEWDYTWMDILPQRSDIMDVNLMIETGIRF